MSYFLATFGEPLLNDYAEGYFTVGDVDVVTAINGTATAQSLNGLILTDATVVTGTGSVSIDQRFSVNDSVGSQDNGFYVIYTPGRMKEHKLSLSTRLAMRRVIPTQRKFS